ncbi:MAG: thermonuclease family protein [Planctomycetota bacterium]|jgi:micrococcal nuclease
MLRKANRPTYAMSKRRKAGIITLCLILAVIFIWLDRSLLKHRRQQRPKSGKQAKAYDLEKYHKNTFTVVKVVDGDTIDIDIPDVNHNHTRIRLWGIDTPETKNQDTGVMYFGPEAAEFTIKLILGKQVTVYLDEHSTRGKYGRLLAYVQLPDDGFLNEVLLTEGFAYADLRFRHSFYRRYEQLQTSAHRKRKGLWGKVTQEQLPEWLQRMKPDLLVR